MKQTHWADGPFIGFDTESTGIDTSTARIIQAAIITHNPTGPLDDDRILYVDPGVPIPAEAAAVHGITAEKLQAENAMPSSSAIPYIFGCIGGRATMRRYPLVIYNVNYDWPLLMAECARIPDFDYRSRPWPLFLDPLVIDRALDKYRKGSRRLEDVARFYDVALDGAHDAAADTKAALGVMRALIKAYPQLRTFDLPTLQKMQADWHAEWRNHINEYWRKTGKPDRVTSNWPAGKESQ